MGMTVSPMFPGMLHDAALRLADAATSGVSLRTPAQTWQDARDMGWPSVLVAPAHGGLGGELSDVAAMIEGLASQNVMVPVAERCAAVPTLLAGVGTAGARDLLQWIAAGTADVTWLAPRDAQAQGTATAVTAHPMPGGWRLQGPVLQREAIEATHALVIATLRDPTVGEVPALFALPMAASTDTEHALAADGSGQWHHATATLTVPAGGLLASGPAVAQAQSDALTLSRLLLSVDTLAAMGTLIELTLQHLSTREQFNVPLATFQVLRHRMVDAYVSWETARGLMLHAFDQALTDLTNASADVALLKYYLGHVARPVAQSAIQMHGALGMSEELPAARLARRLIVNDFRHGDRYLLQADLTHRLATDGPAIW